MASCSSPLTKFDFSNRLMVSNEILSLLIPSFHAFSSISPFIEMNQFPLRCLVTEHSKILCPISSRTNLRLASKRTVNWRTQLSRGSRSAVSRNIISRYQLSLPTRSRDITRERRGRFMRNGNQYSPANMNTIEQQASLRETATYVNVTAGGGHMSNLNNQHRY